MLHLCLLSDQLGSSVCLSPKVRNALLGLEGNETPETSLSCVVNNVITAPHLLPLRRDENVLNAMC
jgi:hypothetical protein